MEEKKDENSEGIGKINDQYIILQKLSYGGQANVFSVKDIKSNFIYAAKIPKIKDDSMKDEIKILNFLKSKNIPNIVNIIDNGNGIIIRNGREPETSDYLILELASKRSLLEYIEFPSNEKGFGETYSKVIFYKIVKNIQIIHEKGICHRDIKIDNILLDGNDFDPKISDFGFAIEYSPTLKGNLGTRHYKAPEIDDIYDGYKIDVFSLGITLIAITYGLTGFETEPKKSQLYPLIISKDKKKLAIYWKVLKKFNEKIVKATDDFKDLYYKMVELNPKQRITIEEILKHKWFGKIPQMTQAELKQYEKEIKIKEEFQKREIIVMECCKEEIQKNIESSDNKYYNTQITKSSKTNSEGVVFKNELNTKYIEKNKYMNYCIHIKGISNLKDFLNILVNQIKEKFQNCLIKTDEDNKPNFNVTFTEEGIYEDIKEQLQNLGIENEEKEDDEEEDDINELILRIKLYKTSEGYLLRFVKKQGNKIDFINKFGIIKNFIKEII